MFTLLVVLHVIFCVFLILVILLQTGKGAGMGTAFGGASQTVFGPRGAGSFIGKLTGIVAALFMLTSLVLAYMSSSGSSGVADKVSALSDEQAKDVEDVDLDENEAATGEATTDATDASVEKKGVDAETPPPSKTLPENKEPSKADAPAPVKKDIAPSGEKTPAPEEADLPQKADKAPAEQPAPSTP